MALLLLKKSLEKAISLFRTEANIDYPKADEDQMKQLDTLAAYYVKMANKEKKHERKRDLYTKVRINSLFKLSQL